MGISLYDHEQRIKNIDVKIVEITNKITELENRGPGFEVVTVTAEPVDYPYNSRVFNIDPKFADYDFYIIGVSGLLKHTRSSSSRFTASINMNKTIISIRTGFPYAMSGSSTQANINVRRTGNQIIFTGEENTKDEQLTLTLLFYKQ